MAVGGVDETIGSTGADDFDLIDVREPHEYQICNIGGHLIPLGDLPKSEVRRLAGVRVHHVRGRR